MFSYFKGNVVNQFEAPFIAIRSFVLGLAGFSFSTNCLRMVLSSSCLALAILLHGAMSCSLCNDAVLIMISVFTRYILNQQTSSCAGVGKVNTGNGQEAKIGIANLSLLAGRVEVFLLATDEWPFVITGMNTLSTICR